MFQKLQERTLKQNIQAKNDVLNFKEYFLKEWKHAPSAFGYVEGAGFFYGMSLLARTPTWLFVSFSNKMQRYTNLFWTTD
jgi:hypothetical protein